MSEFQPYEPDEPAQPPRGQVRLVMLAALLLVVSVGIWGFASLRNQWASESATTKPTATATSSLADSPSPTRTARPRPSVQVATPVAPTPGGSSSASPTPTSRPSVALPGGARTCDDSGEVRAASGTPKTSCSFAVAVRDAWVAAGKGDRTVRAHSTVTGQDYSMTCAGGPLTTCRGGNNAVVYLY